MSEPDGHIPIHHQRLKSEIVVSVLVSDWNDIVEEIDEIQPQPALWGNLAFTALGFGLSVILSVALYHFTATEARSAVLGFGYGLGPLMVVTAVPLYLLQKRQPQDPLLIKRRLKKLIAKIESKQEEVPPSEPEGFTNINTPRTMSAKELKEKSFQSLMNPRISGEDDG